MPKILLYDTTLRDGAQGHGLAFSPQDKLRAAELLDRMQVDYIEAGAPASNPKDAEFFERMGKLGCSRLVAFGPTTRPGVSPCDDAGIAALLAANTDVCCIFGKAWTLHVDTVLGTTRDENLSMIHDTVAYLKARGREVHFDAEHFFDGYKDDRAYALACIDAAETAGADYIVLCDTNGGTFPDEVAAVLRDVGSHIKTPLGIHAHNDCGMADAVAVAAVRAGVVMVQCTMNGWGERCGNTNLFTTAANLTLKLGYETLPQETFKNLAAYSREFCELCNREPYPHAPYVGPAAYAHKAGMHIDAVQKNPESFEHIDPSLVGAERRFLVSEFVGRSAVWSRARLIEPSLEKQSAEVGRIVAEIKSRELAGYQFEGADASFALLVKRAVGTFRSHFELVGFNVTINEPSADDNVATAVVRMKVGDRIETGGAAGNGPVHALDAAMRIALERFYPDLRDVRLEDYRVRVLGSRDATASHVRVIIESSHGGERWATVGVSADVVGASYTALVDAFEYFLQQQFS